METQSLLDAALEAARRADPLIRQYFDAGPEARLKADRTPVTEADLGAERVIREILAARFPSHDFYGEETGRSGEGADVLWLVDPIDGTRAFVRGYPFFSTQVAAMAGGELLAGVSHAPLYGPPGGETARAGRGLGAWLGERPLRVSDVSDIADAHISVGNLRTMAGGPHWRVLGKLVRQAARVRGYGDFLQYHLLASGRIDAVIESDVNILDIAALTVIVREAGGAFTDLSGAPVTLATTSVLAANPQLHQELLRMFEAAG